MEIVMVFMRISLFSGIEHDWFEMKLFSLVLSTACVFGID
ncbi:hypothetical protein SLEP1_g13201 [Rubroshorea leprosula]|uniref:Uncharacterized protein n=1 Tax=Rubroshorea leprosula TaxID=152421 RepID=A0AAV5IPH0_9ROSI|nr:hypothetical protein SLEP1_g13201 [Rubroshorea leprosula]